MRRAASASVIGLSFFAHQTSVRSSFSSLASCAALQPKFCDNSRKPLAMSRSCQPAYKSTSIQPQHSVAYGIQKSALGAMLGDGCTGAPNRPQRVSLWSSPFQIVMLLGRIDRLRAVALAGSQRRTQLAPSWITTEYQTCIEQLRIGSHQLRGAHARIRINCHSVVSFKQLSQALDASEPEWMDRFDHRARPVGSNANNRMMKMTSGRRVTFMSRPVGSPPNASPRRGGGSSPDGTAR